MAGLGERHGCEFENPRDRGRSRPALERIRSAGYFVHEHAEREQIGPEIHLVATNLFRRHVSGRPEHITVLGQVRGSQALHSSEAEIEHFHDARSGSHHVLGFEIAMHDTLCVSGGQRTRQLGRDVDDLGHGNRP